MKAGGFWRIAAPNRRHPADSFRRGNLRFVGNRIGRHRSHRATPSSKSDALLFEYRYPSPSLRPDPLWVGPSFFVPSHARRSRAYGLSSRRICFRLPTDRLESASITNAKLVGGGLSCRNQEWSLRALFSCRLQDACRPMANVHLRVQLSVRLRPTRLTRTHSPAPRSAALRVRSATTSTFARAAFSCRIVRRPPPGAGPGTGSVCYCGNSRANTLAEDRLNVAQTLACTSPACLRTGRVS